MIRHGPRPPATHMNVHAEREQTAEDRCCFAVTAAKPPAEPEARTTLEYRPAQQPCRHSLLLRPKTRLATADVPMAANIATIVEDAQNSGTNSRAAMPGRSGLSVEGSCVITVMTSSSSLVSSSLLLPPSLGNADSMVAPRCPLIRIRYGAGAGSMRPWSGPGG